MRRQASREEINFKDSCIISPPPMVPLPAQPPPSAPGSAQCPSLVRIRHASGLTIQAQVTCALQSVFLEGNLPASHACSHINLQTLVSGEERGVTVSRISSRQCDQMCRTLHGCRLQAEVSES